jgi:methylglyoxal reductase
MQYRPLGNSGLSASIIGLGTWVTGGGGAWGTEPDDRESIRAIQASLDAGVNLIDTAPGYGWGRSETIVGKAIQGRRDQVILATKCGLWTDDDRGSFFVARDGKTIRRSLRPDTLVIEIERSLKFLGVDCIDLYQTHWPSVPPDFTPIADTMAALLKLKQQ